MDFFESCQERQSAMGWKNLFNFCPLTPQQRKHLVRVHAALLTNVLLTALGVFMQRMVVDVPTALLLLLQLGCVWGVTSTSPRATYPQPPVMTPFRAACFGGFGFLSGLLLGDFLYVANVINPSIVPSAFLLSVALFASLTAAAAFSRDRKFLYLGSMLGTAITVLSGISLASLFWPTKIAHDLMLWGGLFVYAGFILFDTQVTLEMAKRGATDYLMHALQFYADFVGIFIRVVQVLAEREARRKRRRDDE